MRRSEAFADTPVRAVLSIRRRVLGLAFLVLAISAMVFAVFLRDYANRAADRAFDRLLAASALSIAGAVQVEDGRVTVELPLASLAMLGAGGDRVFYLVEAPDGAFVTGYPDLAAGRPRAARAEPNFEDLTYRGERVRVATIGRLSSVGGGAGFVSIRVAETRRGREALANEILARAVLPLVALLLVALAVVWFGVRRAFVPLAGIEQELRERAPDDLSPLRLPVPLEVMALVAALNDFMRRLDSSLKTLSGLVADAAHQVRTPLAALRAQAEVALEERDPAKVRERLVRIHRNATATSDLVNQLLMEAIVAHRLETREVAPLTPAVIVDEVRARLDDDDEGRLTVSVAPAARGVTIWGDRLALREMLRNLVENALAYSDDDVDIDVAPAGPGRVAVSVADRGDGIADDETALVLQRVRRGRDDADREPARRQGRAAEPQRDRARAGRRRRGGGDGDGPGGVGGQAAGDGDAGGVRAVAKRGLRVADTALGGGRLPDRARLEGRVAHSRRRGPARRSGGLGGRGGGGGALLRLAGHEPQGRWANIAPRRAPRWADVNEQGARRLGCAPPVRVRRSGAP